MSDWRPGDTATWMHVPRGGYGYVVPVDATVTRVRRASKVFRVRRIVGRGDRVWLDVWGPIRVDGGAYPKARARSIEPEQITGRVRV